MNCFGHSLRHNVSALCLFRKFSFRLFFSLFFFDLYSVCNYNVSLFSSPIFDSVCLSNCSFLFFQILFSVHLMDSNTYEVLCVCANKIWKWQQKSNDWWFKNTNLKKNSAHSMFFLLLLFSRRPFFYIT